MEGTFKTNQVRKNKCRLYALVTGVAERAIGIIESAGVATKVQALEMYLNQIIPSGDNLWAEQATWACHALNRTAISAYLGKQDATWNVAWIATGKQPFSCSKPGFCRVQRTDELQRKAQRCWYLDPAPGYLRDSVKVITQTGHTITTRHVTWAFISPTPSLAPLQAIPTPGGERDDHIEGRPACSEPVE